MRTKLKKLLRLRLTINDHHELGHKLVTNWGKFKVGEKYNFDLHVWKVVEIGKGDLAGHLWIEKT